MRMTLGEITHFVKHLLIIYRKGHSNNGQINSFKGNQKGREHMNGISR